MGAAYEQWLGHFVGMLRADLRQHNHRYYKLNAPEISDGEYDRRMRILAAIEKEYPELVTADSPTQVVGCE